MNQKILALAVAAALVAAGAVPDAVAQQAGRGARTAPAPTVTAAEVDALRAQLQSLQERLAQIEQAQAAASAQAAAAEKVAKEQVVVNSEQQDAIDRTTDNLARTSANVGEWVGRFQWKGDLRYRNETIDQEYLANDRNRDRIRLRAGFFARVNDTMRVEVQATTTEGFDARSSNQTLTDANSRKPLDLDTAYAEWTPNATWRVTFGKMRYPWVRTSSYFYDGDINPEGFAINYQPRATGVFASAFATKLAERALNADSSMFGAQLGWRENFGDGGRWLLAASYFDHGGVEGYNVSQAGIGGFFGNSTTTSRNICRSVITVGLPCLANDYNIIEALGEVQFKVAGQPLLLFGNYAQNTEADYSFVSTNPTLNIPAGLDTAYALGFTFGRASTPGTWEFGAMYQKIEKDALFAQWIDSDFAGGLTDGDGYAIRFAYQFARNLRLNGTYMMNDQNNDVATGVTFPIARNVFDREYKRLQIDLNMTF